MPFYGMQTAGLSLVSSGLYFSVKKRSTVLNCCSQKERKRVKNIAKFYVNIDKMTSPTGNFQVEKWVIKYNIPKTGFRVQENLQ